MRGNKMASLFNLTIYTEKSTKKWGNSCFFHFFFSDCVWDPHGYFCT